MSKAATKIAKGMKSIDAALAGVRERIAALHDQLDELEHTPVTVDEALARLDAMMPDLESAGAPHVGLFFGAENDRLNAYDIGISPGSEGKGANRFLSWLLADTIRERLAAEIQRHGAEHGTGLSSVARRDQLLKLQASLAAAESEEEAIIRAAEDLGMQPARRPDADPEVVLRD